MAVSNGCLFFALYTLVPTFAQTTTSETRAVERSQSARESDSQPVSTPPSATEQAQQTQQFIEERLAVWRQRLKLEEWRISVVMTRRGDLKPKTLGGTRWDKNQKSAVIWVLDPCDYRLPFSEMMGDMEMTVVHELIHLKLASLPRSEASRNSEEHAVNGIAEALLELDRKKQCRRNCFPRSRRINKKESAAPVAVYPRITCIKAVYR